MKPDEAIKYAARLGALKFAPDTPARLASVAEVLAELCADESQAEWLVREMRKRFDEYPGPATLRTVYSGRYGNPDAKDETWSPQWKNERACDQCSDIGLFRNRHAVYQRCSCESGHFATDEMLADLNARLKPGSGLTRVREIKRKPPGQVKNAS